MRPWFERREIHVDGELYMTRTYLWPRTRDQREARRHLPSLMLHRIHLPDANRKLHDHPWWFVSIMLRGRYLEVSRGAFTVPNWRWRRAPSVAYRSATHLHRIDDVGLGVTTLVLAGPAKRTWGFANEDGTGWRPFTEALGLASPLHGVLPDRRGSGTPGPQPPRAAP